MDPVDLMPLLEQLDDNVDDLEEALQPILERQVSETSKKLPVLDKAKLHVLVTYALESLIFSYLRLHGVNAKEHPVFRELTRVKQYFEKIKALETEPEKRTMTLDKQAAGRFIKHGLAGNDKIDLERKEREAKEKARAQVKASLLAKKAASENSSKDPSSHLGSNSESGPDNGDSDDEEMGVDSAPAAQPTEATQPTHSEKKRKSKAKHEGPKAPKQRKKQNKEERQETKKERRQKKEEKRKARNAK
ncbi:hypothetical protein AWENTII_012356 [Aspergillus wentii]|nr:hypothetical protein MW887_002833 [Aspergillus wentii]